jgi:RNase P subunit RPR2
MSTAFYASTSRPGIVAERLPTTCRKCGSQLIKGSKVRRDVVAGSVVETTTFRCRCGGGRRVKRRVGA